MTDSVVFSEFGREKGMREALRNKFPPEQIGKLPASAKRPALDYVGHAAVTDRLNQFAPEWEYAIDETFVQNGEFWIRGTMTIGGVSRPEYGDGKDPKEAIGNFIRRGAMRFGVALDLWSKEELSGGSEGFGEGLTGPSDTTSAPRIDTLAERGSIEGGGGATASRVGADESPTGTPGDEGLVRQEATDPSSSGPVDPLANHLHGPYSEKRPDGNPMRSGWLRCEGCDMAFRDKAVAV